MDFDKIKENIHKTGFVLEYKVTRLLEENGWNVINNRYYLDDVQPINREIDMVAYKVAQIEEIYYFTCLIVSCKKSEKDLWGFLTKDTKENDPNINICPIWNWSNDTILDFMIDQPELEKKVWDLTSSNPHLKFTYGINDQVFAYQQLNKESYKPQNDKDIYNSIVTSIKALEYEKSALDKRIKHKALYNFNILSIFDGDMVKMHFDGDKETTEEIDEIKYLNRLIFNDKEGFYRIHFLKYDELNNYIKHFNELAKWNLDFYSKLITEYYDTVFTMENNKGIELLKNDFESEVLWHLNLRSDYILEDVALKYDTKEKVLKVGIGVKDAGTNFELYSEVADYLNNKPEAKEDVKGCLKTVYKYTGEFVFEDFMMVTLPF
ncbi:hypothetical protein ACFQ4X_05540 [Fictibacillus halophilus]|uniref:hypothetical protein n=1 Tax=Fictibacillus halophilus TaxID=1610490 RepID=UPI00363E0776